MKVLRSRCKPASLFFAVLSIRGLCPALGKLVNFPSYMKRKIVLLFTVMVTLIISCNNPLGFKKPEDGLDAGREFIRRRTGWRL